MASFWRIMDRAAGKTSPSFSEQYLPKTATVPREGHGPGRGTLLSLGLREPEVHFAHDIGAAVAAAHRALP